MSMSNIIPEVCTEFLPVPKTKRVGHLEFLLINLTMKLRNVDECH